MAGNEAWAALLVRRRRVGAGVKHGVKRRLFPELEVGRKFEMSSS